METNKFSLNSSRHMIDKTTGIVYCKDDLNLKENSKIMPEKMYHNGKYIESKNLADVNNYIYNDMHSIFKEDDEFVDLSKFLNDDYSILIKEVSFKISEIESLNKLIATNNLDVEASRLVIIKLLSEKEELEQKIAFFKDLIEVKNDDNSNSKNNSNLIDKVSEYSSVLMLSEEYKDLFMNKHNELVNNRKNKKSKNEISFKNLSSKILSTSKIVDDIKSLGLKKKEDKVKMVKSFTIKNSHDWILVLIGNEILFYNNLVSEIKFIKNLNMNLSGNKVNGFRLIEVENTNSEIISILLVWNEREIKMYRLNIEENKYVDLIDLANVDEKITNIIDVIEHQIKDYIVIITNNGWYILNLQNSSVHVQVSLLLKKYKIISFKTDLSDIISGSLHPDGIFLALGLENGLINIFDITTTEQVMVFDTNSERNNIKLNERGVNQITFSENGYLMSCLNGTKLNNNGHTNEFNVLDLRKTENVISSYEVIKTMDNINSKQESYAIKKVSYDSSGTFLIIGGDDLRIYNHKSSKTVQTNEFKIIDKEEINDFDFSCNSKSNIIITINNESVKIIDISSN